MRMLASGLAVVAFVAACEMPEHVTADYHRITSSEFTTMIVGKTLVGIQFGRSGNEGSTVILHADGKITGDFPGIEVHGTWEWVDDQYCSEVVMGADILPYECKEAWISGEYLRVPARVDPHKFVYYRIL